MKFKFNLIIALATLCVTTWSCTGDFVDINTNPNESAKVSPQALIGPTLYKTLAANLDRNMRINNELMQVTVTTNNNLEFHRYEVRATETEHMWRNWYVELTNIRDIYTSAGVGQQSGYKAYQGVSRILDVWVSSMLTDMYGDVPYFESNLGYKELNRTPVYDKQIDIYRDLFLKLEQANQLLSEDELPESHQNMDPLFAGNTAKWRKFGNSLYLRLLLRVSHKPELNAVLKIREIVETKSSQYPIMSSHDDSAILYFTTQEPYINPYMNSREIDFNGNKGYSHFFIENLIAMADPRLSLWATQPTLGSYLGMQSGYPRGQVPERLSTFHPSLMTSSRLGNILNYAELQFILAECALKGITYSGDAWQHYQNGVNSAMQIWGVELPATYLSNERVGFFPTDTNESKLKKIHLQKYYSLFFTDFQQWYEYRRTRALDLIQGPGLEGRKMPVRMTYPLITQALNKDNYDEASARMGGNTPNSLMWWQPAN
ncbi:SusD/RagB family nutrient-binding outer membrane lipoprotein [Sphingobacterium bovisgrunnientis]|uniref:SusD/RagB family nutrient-binding outer membrane lipoprotein n=1 Tax=Sphingobacterium bovisgrunnientis TaxID=1874697 RepID=UPI001357E6CC|nr:SusD/RagB family nutrient-binding outer membrane lipoprotein [Sphingobacterium bovisgrunnientis]